MANVLFAWELGGGLGHLARAVPVLARLKSEGHSIYAAVRDLRGAIRFNDKVARGWMQAPVQISSSKLFEPPHTFAHILANMCFGDRLSLHSRVAGWSTLFELIKPELLLLDHAPTAVLASHGSGCRRMIIGTGFCCPRPLASFPNWRPERLLEGRSIKREESEVLAAVNQWLKSNGRTQVQRLADLFSAVDDTVLATYPELDHFGPRPDTPYSGVWTSSSGKAFQWPKAGGPKVFAYLKQFRALSAMLEMLGKSPICCVVFAPGISPTDVIKYQSTRLTISPEPLDMKQAAVECDIAISHGGHGTVAAMLLAGKPMMVLPQQLEQRLTGENITRMGAGLMVNPGDTRALATLLKSLVTKPDYRKSAMTFARRHSQFDPGRSLDNVVQRCLRLIPTASK